MLRDVLKPEIGKLINSANLTLNLNPNDLFVAVGEMVELEPAEEEKLFTKIKAEEGNPEYTLGLLLISATISLLGDGGIPYDKIPDALENPEAHISILNDISKLNAVLDFLKKREDSSGGAFERFISEMGKKIQEAGKRLDQEMDIRLKEQGKQIDERMAQLKKGEEQNNEKILALEEKIGQMETKIALLNATKNHGAQLDRQPQKAIEKAFTTPEYVAAVLIIFASTSAAIHLTVATPETSKMIALVAFFVAVIIIIQSKLFAKKQRYG